MPIPPVGAINVRIKTPRGITLSAYLYARDPKKIVITSHGFTSDQFGKSTLVAQKLADTTISALTFDYSGCGESDDDTISVAKEVEDLTTVIEYAESLGYEHIGIMGTSLGGLIALRCWNPAIKTLVLWCPVTHDWSDIIKDHFSKEELEEFKTKGYCTRQKGQPSMRTSVVIDKAVLEERRNINTGALISRITCPVLIFHGDKDTVLPLSDSQDAIRYLSRDSHLEVIPGADHFFEKERSDLITRSAEWFAEHL